MTRRVMDRAPMDERGVGRIPEEMCTACKEDWLSEELEFEMEGITNA